MSEQITREIFDHMVELAALELQSDEAEYLRTQLNNQLKAIEELAAIQIDEDVPFASHGVPYTPQVSQQVREDILLPFPTPEDIIAGAPKTEAGYIVVPDIPHEDLD
ncbi:MAG: aspartyl/glutamyl-tRNA amidotransferase subunit C [Anaerolineae bacterium]|nr:aspartyl/glutamyl-tRNA amidotransferase subunit C [Anaerolineae bacterium]